MIQKQNLGIRAKVSADDGNAHGRKKLYPLVPTAGEHQGRFFYL